MKQVNKEKTNKVPFSQKISKLVNFAAVRMFFTGHDTPADVKEAVNWEKENK